MGFEEQGATPSRAKHHRGFNHHVILGTKQLSRGKNTPTLGTLKHRDITNKRDIKETKQKQHVPGAPKWGCRRPRPSPWVPPRENGVGWAPSSGRPSPGPPTILTQSSLSIPYSPPWVGWWYGVG